MQVITGKIERTMLTILALLMGAGLFGLLLAQGPSSALAYDDYLDIDCKDDPVSEGDTFRIHIVSTQPYLYDKETMKVSWTTYPRTADETDYSPLHHVGQASNSSQTDDSRMGRTFYTTEDEHSEFTEEFRVCADNASSLGTGAGACTIEIEDNDGTAADLEHEGFEAADHKVDGVAPTFETAEISEDGTKVTIAFTEDVDVSSQLHTLSTFAGVDVGVYLQVLVDIFADGHRMHTSSADISGAGLTLTLDTPISQGQSVTVTCDNIFTSHLPGLLTGKAGNALGHFTGQSVTNNSTAAANEDAIWPVLSEHSLTVAEGGTSTYTIALDSRPEEDVTVSHTISPGGHLTADLTELTFTTENWETAQTVTLTAASDEDDRHAWQEIIHTSEAEGFVAGHVKVLVEE